MEQVKQHKLSYYNINVKRVHFEIPRPLMKIIGLFMNNKERRLLVNTKKTSNKGGLRTLLYGLLYLIIGIWFYVKVLYLVFVNGKRSHGKLLLICDRYPLIDGSAHITYNAGNLIFTRRITWLWRYFEIVLSKTVNQLCIHFHIDPKIVRKRRPEHNIKRLRIHQILITFYCIKYKRHCYIILDANKSLDSICNVLFYITTKWLNY